MSGSGPLFAAPFFANKNDILFFFLRTQTVHQFPLKSAFPAMKKLIVFAAVAVLAGGA
jgi:hypothetical protein